MPISEWNQDSLVLRFVMTDDGPDFYEPPGFEPPAAWRLAIGAVARDLSCLRYGRDVQVERLVWELAISDQYAVTIGWRGPAVGGFNLCHGVRRKPPTRRPRSGTPTPRKASSPAMSSSSGHREDGTSSTPASAREDRCGMSRHGRDLTDDGRARLSAMFEFYDRHGFLAGGAMFESLLGRPPARIGG
ncbi:hypothetical protein [Rhodococcus tibetensis]|uniref:hypothetical protein n=1 Tax=Rhodococcus tibetensis TaxID=2965064 RepID=UPI0035AC1628